MAFNGGGVPVGYMENPQYQRAPGGRSAAGRARYIPDPNYRPVAAPAQPAQTFQPEASPFVPLPPPAPLPALPQMQLPVTAAPQAQLPEPAPPVQIAPLAQIDTSSPFGQTNEAQQPIENMQPQSAAPQTAAPPNGPITPTKGFGKGPSTMQSNDTGRGFGNAVSRRGNGLGSGGFGSNQALFGAPNSVMQAASTSNDLSSLLQQLLKQGLMNA